MEATTPSAFPPASTKSWELVRPASPCCFVLPSTGCRNHSSVVARFIPRPWKRSTPTPNRRQAVQGSPTRRNYVGIESVIGRVVFTALIFALTIIFAFLPQRREKKKRQRDRLFTQSLARQHLARSRRNNNGSVDGRSVPSNVLMLISQDTKGGEANDTVI